ncbi:MAG TPA: hypothetical protein VNR36_01515 [Pseudolysinimonas sp.]|nr:hypothetical protein [Pseudolysinimonas sp.]
MNRIAAVLLASTIIVLSTAAPAAAGETDTRDEPSRVCWTAPESEGVTCFADEETWKDAVYEQTGRVVLEEGESARGLLATYVIARLYQDASYGGSVYAITSTSSTICSTGSVQANLPAAWSDVVSSFRSYLGCTTTLYENTGQGGASISGTNVTSLGSMNDKASSYRVS